MRSFGVVVHLPKAEQAKQSLAKAIAEIHATAIHGQIQKMAGSSKEDKVRLVQAVQDSLSVNS